MSLVVRGLHVTGDDGTVVLSDISVEFPTGAVTLVVGQTGSGKSTLLDALTGLRQPAAGDIVYDGVPLWLGRKPNEAVLRHIGTVFQFPEHQLFARTVKAEFDYSLRPYRLPRMDADARVREAMAAVGLPLGLLGEPPLLLSGGQRRRVALATTLATGAEWLLLDEPTAGLDPEGTTLLLRLLEARRGRQNGGVVIATHDLDNLLPLADRIVWLHDGRVRFCGDPLDWLSDPSWRDAGLGEPACVQVQQALTEYGVTLPAPVLSPEALAEVLLTTKPDRTAAGSPPRADHAAVEPGGKPVPGAHGQAKTGIPPRRHGLRHLAQVAERLDPRAKWALYVLVCAGMLVQSGWPGLGVATAVAGALVLASGVAWSMVWRMTKPLWWFMLLSALLSGLRVSPGVFGGGHVDFDTASALDTVRRLYPLWLMMAVGVLLPATTGTMRMKRGLEAGLSLLKRLHLPVEAVSLAAALILRFIPVIMAELRRFSRIARARGKAAGRGGLRPRDVPAVVVPLLLSVIQMGEDLSLAMEARGYVRIGQPRTSALRLQWSRSDSAALAVGAALFALLWAVRDLH